MPAPRLDVPAISYRKATPSPVDYFDQVYAAFEGAESQSNRAIERFFDIGGYVIALRFAGPALDVPITRALAPFVHTAQPGATPDDLFVGQCVDGFSDAATSWGVNDYGARGEIRGYNTERIHTTFQTGPGALSMFDSETNRALFWVYDASRIPEHEIGLPLRNILHWWLREHGRQMVHAGAVGNVQGGVLLAGGGGSGKSTSALACLDTGLLYAGDDFVLLSAAPTAFVYNVYNSAKLNADNLVRFPEMRAHIANLDWLESGKAIVYLQEEFPGKLVAGFPLRAILVPRVTGGNDTSLHPINPAASLAALAPSTTFQLPGVRPETLHILARIVTQVPGYLLELGRDIAQIPMVISSLLSELK